MADLEWLIIGGGIHGTHLALALVCGAGVEHDQIRVLDPQPQPIARWKECVANCGMTFLRSPGVHHLDLDPKALTRFAKTEKGRQCEPPKGIYWRPSVELFHTHVEELVMQHGLAKLWCAGRAIGLERVAAGWRVAIEAAGKQTAIVARHVLLAMGAADQPAWPTWAGQIKDAGAPIWHLYEHGFVRSELNEWQHAVVIGQGISAVQAALALAQQAPGQVTLLQRRAAQVVPFDSDPCWMGPKCQNGFAKEPNYTRRRTIIRAARHRGSIPDYVACQLRRAVSAGALVVQHGEVQQAQIDGQIELVVGTWSIVSDCVLLATGFAQQRPGGAWIDRAIAAHHLPVAPCGYPIVDHSLCWAEGLFVSGPLAELEIGPVSRNIAGARQAAIRIVDWAKHQALA
ncbi:MAG: FAD/NAD(P)-binding protein [Roseiflexaceae bacterium]